MSFFTFCRIVLFIVIVSNIHAQNDTIDSYEPDIYGPYEIDDLDYEVPEVDDYTEDDYVDWKPFPGKKILKILFLLHRFNMVCIHKRFFYFFKR